MLDTGRTFRDAQARVMAEAHTGDARIAMREHASGPSVNSTVNSWDEGKGWTWCLGGEGGGTASLDVANGTSAQRVRGRRCKGDEVEENEREKTSDGRRRQRIVRWHSYTQSARL